MKPSIALQIHRDAIHEIVGRHHARNPRVFGSAARGDDGEDSDVDILVDPAPGMTLFDVGGMIAELETLLGRRVDVLTPGGMGPEISGTILRDLRPV